MPFDKKLACLTNYQERRSFPWPLVSILFWIITMKLLAGEDFKKVRILGHPTACSSIGMKIKMSNKHTLSY